MNGKLMKQIIQSLKNGNTSLEEIPAPVVQPGHLLIRTTYSLVSLGTERMLVEFGKSNLIAKAKQQPDKVKQVLEKIRSEGLLPTMEAVFNKLDQPLPLGYCNVGRIVEVGEGVTGFRIGDRVVSNGPHAEMVLVPQNLVARIPDNVSDEQASFTVIGSIGLQGIRLCNPQFGETIAVVGLGLIGLITGELLMANGCRVIGIDPDPVKIKLAKTKGMETVALSAGEDPVNSVLSLTGHTGADGVIITASSSSDAIIKQAAQMSRKRGRIILVGVIGLELSRADFYEKELTFQVSCSYGPGRYDEEYELKGMDYPLPYVRWTEKRNFESILAAISRKQLIVEPLISEVVELKDFEKIYLNISDKSIIASIIKYPEAEKVIPSAVTRVEADKTIPAGAGGKLAIIGAGNFTQMTLLPAISKTSLALKSIVSQKGMTASTLAKKYNIPVASSDYKDVLTDPDIGTVIITTRHNLHASMVTESLEAGKNVFVEKPLALNADELDQIIRVYNDSGVQKNLSLTVGYNRRFSPHALKAKKLLGDEPGPMNITATMNAGFIPSNVWVHDLLVGGGRILGEACHFIDLLIYLTGSLVSRVQMNGLGPDPLLNTDNASMLVSFANGASGVINYFSNGSRSYAKERIEVFSKQRTLVIDNFKSTNAYGFKGFKQLKTKLDKGHKEQFRQLEAHLVKGGSDIIPFEEIVNSTRTAFAALESMKKGEWVQVD